MALLARGKEIVTKLIPAVFPSWKKNEGYPNTRENNRFAINVLYCVLEKEICKVAVFNKNKTHNVKRIQIQVGTDEVRSGGLVGKSVRNQ